MGTQVFRSNVDCTNYRIDIFLDMTGDITMHNILFLFSKYCRSGSHDRQQIKQESNQQRSGIVWGQPRCWSNFYMTLSLIVKGLVLVNAMQVNLCVFHLSGAHTPTLQVANY